MTTIKAAVFATVCLSSAFAQAAVSADSATTQIGGATTQTSGALADKYFVADTKYFTTQVSTSAALGDTPYNVRHRPLFGSDMSGVARLVLNVDSAGFGTLCSGALLATGRHVLTAAHCVTNPITGGAEIDFTNGVVQFPTLPGAANAYGGSLEQVQVTGVTVHPGWTYDYVQGGYDLAILTLASDAPLAATRYDIYTGSDEIGKTGTHSGWGTIGWGQTGATIGQGWRMGQNQWDMTAQTFWSGAASSSIMMYDFDNGLAANDAFDAYFGVAGLGLGDMEVLAGRGDSGGPTFIDGKIAGITSFGITFTDLEGGLCVPGNPDLVCGLNNTFGEFGGDTRVSAYASWIAASVPEPSEYALMILGLAVLGVALRRTRADS